MLQNMAKGTSSTVRVEKVAVNRILVPLHDILRKNGKVLRMVRMDLQQHILLHDLHGITAPGSCRTCIGVQLHWFWKFQLGQALTVGTQKIETALLTEAFTLIIICVRS